MYTKICINIVARSMEKSYPPGLGEYKKKKKKRGGKEILWLRSVSNR